MWTLLHGGPDSLLVLKESCTDGMSSPITGLRLFQHWMDILASCGVFIIVRHCNTEARARVWIGWHSYRALGLILILHILRSFSFSCLLVLIEVSIIYSIASKFFVSQSTSSGFHKRAM